MFGRMSRRDAAAWQATTSVKDLGELMARWLEGSIKSWPGYQPGARPDAETRSLIPALARLNRAGFLTDSSQPGLSRGAWQQRAAVCGYIADRGLGNRLRAAATRAGMVVATRERVVATTRNGKPFTWFGGVMPKRELEFLWRDSIGDGAWSDLERAQPIAFIDPDYGPSNRLWQALR